MDGAVRLDGDKAARGAETRTLGIDDGDMLRVDLGNDHRDVLCSAMSGVVGNNRRFSLGISLLQSTDFFFFHINGAEREIAQRRNRLYVRSVVDFHVFNLFGNLRVHFPFSGHGFLIGLAGRAAACCKYGNFEHRVFRKKGDETLTDHSGGSDDAGSKFVCHGIVLLKV